MRLIKNALYNILYQVFGIIMPIITVPYISRVLGSYGVGEYSYTNSYVQYFIIIGMIGISIYGNRQIAYCKDDIKKVTKEFWSIYSLQLLCTIFSFLVYIIFFVVINKENKFLYLAQSIYLIANIFDISWFFIGYEDMRSVVRRNIIAKLVGVVLIFILIKDSNDIILYTIILSSSTLVGQLVMWINLKGKVNFAMPQFAEIKRHFLPSIGLFIYQLAVQIYVLLDKTMLGIMTNASQVGFYENSQKTIKIALTLATSIGVVMLPRMSNLYSKGNKAEFESMIYKSFSFINLIAFPTFFGVLATVNGFTPWFYGESFNGIQNLIKVGAIIIIPISISNVLGMQIMLPIGQEKKFTVSVLLGICVNVVFNLFLINHLGSMGTTISSVFSEFTVTIVQFYFLRKLIKIKEVLRTIFKPLIGSIIMFIIIYFISINMSISILNTVFQVFVGGVIYLIALLLMKDKFLIEMIKILLNKIKIKR